MSDRQEIQTQFGQNAAAYVHSPTHRLGASLGRLLALLPPDPAWQVLDVATGTGHTALAFAPQVARVWATDVTVEMLALARREAAARGLGNVVTAFADAAALPFANGRFHLVTCRIAPHHFGDVGPFLREAARVLRPGGRLAVVDNVVPDGPGGDYVNAFEKLRDPSHARCLPLAEWLDGFTAAGLAVTHHETLAKRVTFDFWAQRHDAHTRQFLRTMLTHAPEPAAAFLQPQTEEAGLTFRLQEGIVVGRKGAAGYTATRPSHDQPASRQG